LTTAAAKNGFPPFWLGTFALHPETTFCIRANVFKKCFPESEPTGLHALFALNIADLVLA